MSSASLDQRQHCEPGNRPRRTTDMSPVSTAETMARISSSVSEILGSSLMILLGIPLCKLEKWVKLYLTCSQALFVSSKLRSGIHRGCTLKLPHLEMAGMLARQVREWFTSMNVDTSTTAVPFGQKQSLQDQRHDSLPRRALHGIWRSFGGSTLLP